ncbi:TPA: hypothetical protein N0F65_007645 [Lagenidium giganteum]|uniref:Nucleoprotein TPR/MLP1 domain-containing protein n=1 Tax=Lagenidium giganteum TaxID=4803 RepID=A0AAV2Z8K8_9STRA|nr:TPA: hypothetical protein N0F65_007645 [Lagenidium giganteum]
MAGESSAEQAEQAAQRINQEQLFHELEQKYIALKSELTLSETERQRLLDINNDTQAELKLAQEKALEKEAHALKAQEELLKMRTEKEQLQFQLKSTQALADRRLAEVETLHSTVKEQAAQLVATQKGEMDAMQRMAVQETEVEPLKHTVARLQKDVASSEQHSEWLEKQLAEKTKIIQGMRQSLSKMTHDHEELKIKATEDTTSLKRQLENARLASKKFESSLIQAKEQVKETLAAKIHEEERFQNELNAQRRLAELYKESANDANARVEQLQGLCEKLRKSLAESDEALTHETERAREKVEHLFREQTEVAEKQVEALQEELKQAKQQIEELQKNKFLALGNASDVANLSNTSGEVQLAAHGLTHKQLLDQVVELEQKLREERDDKDRVQLYMERIVKEINEKAPILTGLRLDHERAVAAQTQLSERLEVCMQELAKSKSRESQAWKEKQTYENKCRSLAQSVDDLSRQVQHLLFRAHEGARHALPAEHGDVVSENLVVFKDVEELQTRNMQLLKVIRELSEMSNAKDSDDGSVSSPAHLIDGTGDSDDEEVSSRGATLEDRLSAARKELYELRAERDQERQMIAAIVKQRDMYRVLLAQSDNKFLDGADSASSGSTPLLTGPGAGSMTLGGRPSGNHREVTESRMLRELQMEFEDYKKEKQSSMKMLQEQLDQLRTENSNAKVKQMQAEVDAKCSKERFDAAEKRRQDAEEEVIRLRAKTSELSSLLLQHEKLLTDTQSKNDEVNGQKHMLAIEKESAKRELDFLKQHETKLHSEMVSLRLEKTNILKLMESARQMEAARETRDGREKELLSQKVIALENKLQEMLSKTEAAEAVASASTLELQQEKKLTQVQLDQLRKNSHELKEQLVRVEEQKKAAETKAALLEKEVNHLRDQLKKGASAAAAERVAALEVQLRDSQREVQASLAVKKSLSDNVTRYKALAEANEKSMSELSAASEKWKRTQEEQLERVQKEKESLRQELTKVRTHLKEQITESNTLREQVDQAENQQKAALAQAEEKHKLLQLQAESAQKEVGLLREEVKRITQDLNQAQENYERELQLHASEVAKSTSSRKAIEEESKNKKALEVKLSEALTQLECVEKRIADEREVFSRQTKEAIDAKQALVEQNKLLHSQLERAAAELRHLHEQELVKATIERRPSDKLLDEHTKEVDDLRSVVAFLRRESEIASSKVEIAQEEAQRYRAQVFSLESTIERLRGEIKSLTETVSKDKDGGLPGRDDATPSASAKRSAQLEQLNLLRESNATLRDESQKNLARYKQEASKVKALEAQVTPLREAETALKAQVETLKQELATLNEANKRWKQRVDQLVEKYQQVDPAEHDKVLGERESLLKNVAELQSKHSQVEKDLEAASSAAQEAKTAKDNLQKQYDKIKGFAKTWKIKAEGFSKELIDKSKALDDKTAAMGELEKKLSLTESRVSSLEAERVALQSKMSSLESGGATATAAGEKERQDLKDRLEAEQKRLQQLKDLNTRLMAGMRGLKKENSELKDQVANNQGTTTPSASAVASPPAESQKDADVDMEQPVTKSSSTEEATPSTTPVPASSPSAASDTQPPETAKPATAPAPPAQQVSVPAARSPVMAAVTVPSPPPAVPAPAAATTVAVPASVSASTTAPASSMTSAPAKAETKSAPTPEEKLRLFALQSMKKQVLKPATTPVKAAVKPPMPPSEQKTGSASVPPAPASADAAKPAATTETGLKLAASSGAFGGAFGSGSASGLVFGKPGITLPVPSSPLPSPADPASATTAATATAVTAATAPTGGAAAATPATASGAPEVVRRSQRLARFSAAFAGSGAVATPASTISVGVAGVKRSVQATGGADGSPTPSKLLKKSEETPVEEVADDGNSQATDTDDATQPTQ